jgi:hypothetical protein
MGMLIDPSIKRGPKIVREEGESTFLGFARLSLAFRDLPVRQIPSISSGL